MKVYRKPVTAQWHYESAQEVDDVKIKVSPWTSHISITFDATKDKSGERHTTIAISFTEKEIEHLHSKLLEGRKDQIKRLQNEIKQLRSICNLPNKAEIITGSPAVPVIKPFGLNDEVSAVNKAGNAPAVPVIKPFGL